MSPLEVVALSGGKDSTAMALRLAEVEPDAERVYFCTPTGDELPDMQAHWAKLESLLGQPLVRVTEHTLDGLIEKWDALPNGRMRWCTRMLKIRPCLDYLATLKGREHVLCVGLRADEPTREGIYSDDVVNRFPLREWGWGLAEVKGYLRERGVTVPPRTDCARCYAQRLGEWWALWREHPEIWAHAEAQEKATGHTFRSDTRDTWPAALCEMRARFEAGGRPARAGQLPIFDDEDDQGPCRVCRL